jgi:hypothetical protein
MRLRRRTARSRRRAPRNSTAWRCGSDQGVLVGAKRKTTNQATLKASIDKYNGVNDAYNQSPGDLSKLVNELHQKAQGK